MGIGPSFSFSVRVCVRWNYWFLAFLIELPFPIIWSHCFLCEKIFNHWFNFLNGYRTISSWISYDKLYFFLLFYSFNWGLQIYWHTCFIHNTLINLISASSFFIPQVIYLCLLLFFLINFERVLSILLIIAENQLLALFVFSYCMFIFCSINFYFYLFSSW